MDKPIHELFYERYLRAPDTTAYAHYSEKEEVAIAVTNRELHLQAWTISSYLQACGAKVAILLFDDHHSFVKSFMGCQYAGVTAVPMAPPNSRHPWDFVAKVAKESESALIITNHTVIKNFKRRGTNSAQLQSLLVDLAEIEIADQEENQKPKAIGLDHVAVLQYTSGSTGSPKGVKIKHSNILSNLCQIESRFESTHQSSGVIWLPPYHDMGLIGGILLPIYIGFPVTFMSSVSFFKSPVRWLKLIAENPSVISGGPNFAYDLCIDRVSEEDCIGLDLSSWEVAFSGAEKIRYETIQNFVAKFSPYGFKMSSFLTCYGMAESTLLITGIKNSETPFFLNVDKNDLANDKVTTDPERGVSDWLVSSGTVADDCVLAIVSPETEQSLPEGQVGELWVAGASVSDGYLNKEEVNRITFGQQLGDKFGFLRTGDLGFIHNEQVYITGRLKELVILNGKNFYPQDIERTSTEVDPALSACSACFFSVYAKGKQHLFVIQEVKRTEVRKIDAEELSLRIQSAVSAAHGLRINGVFLVKPGTIALTSSGKIKRPIVKEEFLNTGFEDKVIGSRTDDSVEQIINVGEEAIVNDEPLSGGDIDTTGTEKANELIDWLRDYASTRINSRLMDERRSVAPNVVLDFGNEGFFGMQIPQKYGGLGMSYVNTIKVFRQLSAIDVTLGMLVGVNHSLGTRPIVNYAKSALQNEVLPKMASGRELASFAFTEPAAGSNPRGIRSSAIATSKNKWQITGQKEWIGLGAWASTISTFAHVRDDQGKFVGITGFAIRQGDKGLRMGPEAITMGLRAIVQNKIFLEGVEVGDDRLLGELGNGMEVAQDVMAHARFGIGCACLGVLQRCAQLGLRYAQKRTISTGNLLQNPLTLLKLSRLTTIIPAAEVLLFRTGELLDAKFDVPEDAFNACKIILPELLWESIDDVAQLLGGRGYIEDNIIPQMMRDARILRVFEGPTETLKMYLGSQSMRDNSGILNLISEGYKAPEVAKRYQKALDQLRAGMSTSSLFSNSTKSDQWFYLKIGDISAYAIMLAAVSGEGAEKWMQGKCEKTIHWVNNTFDMLIENTLKEASTDVLLLPREEIITHISSYVDVIGDLEQTLAGEDVGIDPYLQKQTKASPNAEVNAFAEQNLVTAEFGNNGADHEENSTVEAETNLDAEAVTEWVQGWIMNQLNLPLKSVEGEKTTFFDMGMDSLISVDFVCDLEAWLQTDLDSSIVWNFPTIKSLVEHLCAESKGVLPTRNEAAPVAHTDDETPSQVDPSHYKFELNERSASLQKQLLELEQSEETSPYFKRIEGVSNDTVSIEQQEFINYSGYNYLGLAGDQRVLNYAQEAIGKYGTSVSASRIISGEIQLHSKLENLLCQTIGFDECVLFTAGHATNVTTIGHIFGPKDLVIYDAYIHSSILEGAKMAGATRIPFPHNNLESLAQILTKQRKKYQQAIIIVEGVYSMDGDVADLPSLIALKQQHQCYLMVDEAHSFGVLGATGKGVSEHFGVNVSDVDIWMGTLSKSLASCGGYIGGSKAIIDYLKYTASGFIYSVGMTPANTAASIAALGILMEEPQRVTKLIANSDLFRILAKRAGFDIGESAHSAVVPIIVRETSKCLALAKRMQLRGINVMPIAPPAVPENSARLRFFINTLHTQEQIELTVRLLQEAWEEVEELMVESLA